MKNICKLATYAFATVIITTQPAWGETGRIVRIYADPGDVVIVLDKAGPCGSPLFHLRRGNENFKEMVSLMYTAAASGKNVDIVVASCANDRNIASHGSANF